MSMYEIENSIVGGVLLDEEVLEYAIEKGIEYTDFQDKKLGNVFRAMVWLRKQGQVVDLLTTTKALQDHNLLESIGGSAYIAELTDSVITVPSSKKHVDIFLEDLSRRNLAKAGQEIIEAAKNPDIKLDEKALRGIKDNIDRVKTHSGDDFQIASMLDYTEEAKQRFDNWGKMQGMSSGFPSIDKLTMGLVGGELIVIAGETSRGKTLLSMNISNKVALRGETVLFVTLEMTHAELTSRYMYINDGETDEYMQVASNTVFQKNDELDWTDIDSLIKNAKEKMNVSLVVIDHLHYFTREVNNLAEDLGRITKEFKKNAIRYDIPVVLISHVRKKAHGQSMVSIDDLRGSSLIGQDADIVMFVHRDADNMMVRVDKNRNRGKVSDRIRDWEGREEAEVNTISLSFNNTKLVDPMGGTNSVLQMFPDAVPLNIKK